MSVKLPSRARLAELLQRRHSEKMARAARSFNWRFWRWRPKVSLASLMALALFGGSVFLICLHWRPWVRVQVLNGHVGLVDSLSFSANGLTLASGGADKTARLWDLRAGKQRAEIKLPGATQVALSPSAELLVTTCFGAPAMSWDADNGNYIRTFHRPGITLPVGANFSADGKRILTFAADGTLMTYTVNGDESRTVSAQPDLHSAQFAGNDNVIVATSNDGKIHVLNVFGRPVAVLQGFSRSFRCATISPDGKRIAAAAFDATASLWRISANDEERTLLGSSVEEDQPKRSSMWYAKQKAKMKGHDQFVLAAKFSNDGERLLTASLDGTVRVWDGHSGEFLSLLDSGKPLRVAVFAPDNMRIACAGQDGSIEIWQRRRREGWIGLVDFPGVWLAIVFFPLLIYSLIRDQRAIPAASIVPSETPPPAAPASDANPS